MSEANLDFVKDQVLETVLMLEDSPSAWVHLSDLGNTLRGYGISYHTYGFEKLKPFLESFEELEFKVVDNEDKPPVHFVRLRETEHKQAASAVAEASNNNANPDGKQYTPDMNLSDWAFIFNGKYHTLVEMMPEEDWGKIEKVDVNGDGEEIRYPKYPKLENYISYTAKRLAHEKKILYAVNPLENIKYAAFNTGLVDKSYDWIYALFKENTRYPDKAPWYLLDFVIVGQNAGKTLNSVFAVLPQRADYFDNINNVLFDTNKRLACDYEHILIEHADRLPPEFIKQSCPEFACIDDIKIEDVFNESYHDEKRKIYYDKLSSKLRESTIAYNRMRKRFDDALRMAVKRVEWNYKTAVPMYYPTKNIGALLLPIALVSPDHVDIALVVTKEPSGTYQGQTILPLSWAYANSRLVAKPNSDWLIDTIK